MFGPFEFASGIIPKPYSAVGWCETKEYSGGDIDYINFCTSDALFFNSDMTTKAIDSCMTWEV